MAEKNNTPAASSSAGSSSQPRDGTRPKALPKPAKRADSPSIPEPESIGATSGVNRREVYCIILHITSDDNPVPHYAWSTPIIRDHILLYAGKFDEVTILDECRAILWLGRRTKNEGLAFDQATNLCQALENIQFWCGRPVNTMAEPLSLKEGRKSLSDALQQAKAKKKLATGATTDPDFDFRGRTLVKSSALSKGRARLKQFSSKAISAGKVSFSAAESETDVADYSQSDAEAEADTETACDDGGDDSDTDVSTRRRHRVKTRGKRGAGREKSKNKLKLPGISLPIFKNSKDSGATTFRQWFVEVKPYIVRLSNDPRNDLDSIHRAVIQTLDGEPHITYSYLMTKYPAPITCVEQMQATYGISMKYQALMRELMTCRQGENDSIDDFRIRIMRIGVALGDRYMNRFTHDNELDNYLREAFYEGLLERYHIALENKYVSGYDLSALIEAAREKESETFYWNRIHAKKDNKNGLDRYFSKPVNPQRNYQGSVHAHNMVAPAPDGEPDEPTTSDDPVDYLTVHLNTVFAEARKQGICMHCGVKWTPGHLSTCSVFQNKLKNGNRGAQGWRAPNPPQSTNYGSKTTSQTPVNNPTGAEQTNRETSPTSPVSPLMSELPTTS